MTLHAAAPLCTSVDPSYAAHVGPIKAWATAWWDGWANKTGMTKAYKHATDRLSRAKVSAWSRVHGPASAMVATCSRIGWRSSDGCVFTDDVGTAHDIALDPPQSIADAAQRSVQRWCLRQVCAELPSAAPPGVVTARQPTAATPPQKTLIDVSAALRPLYKGGKTVTDEYPLWRAEHRAELSSAINGGQWPQARKAKLPEWQHGNRCQLCEEHIGTLAHRKCCAKIVPPEGWPAAPPDVERFVDSLAPARKQALTDRATVAIEIPTPAPQVDTGRWQWVLEPDDMYDETHRWYIDGSRRYPTCHALTVTGCGVAVVNSQGSLVGLAKATPPKWITSSAAAEAWALYLTLQEVAALPIIITDCLGLLRTAEAGFAAATGPKMANARIWGLINELMGGQATQLHRALIWMPAHTSIDQCIHRLRSDLKPVSATDWRANQLADVLAKAAAVDDPRRRAAARFIDTSKRALLHHAVILGMATHGANNHLASHIDEDGNIKNVTLRDSTSLPANARRTRRAPAGIKRKRKEAACEDELAGQAAGASVPRHLLGITRTAERASTKRARAAAANAHEKSILASVVADTAQRLQRPANATSAAERLAALRVRVRLRAQT